MMKHAETDCIVMHCRLDLRISQGLLEQVWPWIPLRRTSWSATGAMLQPASSWDLPNPQIYDMMKCIEVFTWKWSSPVTHNAICSIFMSDTFRYIQIYSDTLPIFIWKMPFLWSLAPAHRPPESGHGSHCPLQIGGLVHLCVCGSRHPGCTPRGSSSDCSGLVGIEWVIRHDEFDLHGMSKHIILAYKQHILAFLFSDVHYRYDG